MNETEVLRKVHSFLKTELIDSHRVVRLFTDAHSHLLPYADLAPFQRFTLDFRDFVLHPDIVGQFDDGETIFAVEGKGNVDLIKGLAQAEMYQSGFHYTFLAAEAAVLGTSLVRYAKSKNVGIIAVSDSVSMDHLPVARMPFRDAYQFVARQMDSAIQVSLGQTYHFNLPTHYLVWCILLEPDATYDLKAIAESIKDYPMPKELRSTLQGAQKLGLVHIAGNEVALTPVGVAVRDLLPKSVETWSQIHAVVSAKGGSIPLVRYHPQSAAVLRLLLLQDALVRLLIDGLKTFPTKSASFDALAVACDRLDHARAPIFFLKPQAEVELADNKGRIRWYLAKGEHYRSTTFYQYKSILRHAGVLQHERLGGASSKEYNPAGDIWTLYR